VLKTRDEIQKKNLEILIEEKIEELQKREFEIKKEKP
jgi:hypothetical protein